MKVVYVVMTLFDIDQGPGFEMVRFWIRKTTKILLMICMLRLKKLQIYMDKKYDSEMKIRAGLEKLQILIVAYSIYFMIYNALHFIA